MKVELTENELMLLIHSLQTFINEFEKPYEVEIIKREWQVDPQMLLNKLRNRQTYSELQG